MVGSIFLLISYTLFAPSFVFVVVNLVLLFCSLSSSSPGYLNNCFIPIISTMGTAIGMMVLRMRKAVEFDVLVVDAVDDLLNDVTNNKLHHRYTVMITNNTKMYLGTNSSK